MPETYEEDCRNCRGKGHVYDAITGLLTGPAGWVLSFCETNDRRGLTRKLCDHCGGYGVIFERKTESEIKRIQLIRSYMKKGFCAKDAKMMADIDIMCE